jgi:hypothetical protein
LRATSAKAQRERVELEEMLAGQIEQKRQRPTKEDLEAKLVRPLHNFRGDGSHVREPSLTCHAATAVTCATYSPTSTLADRS